MDIINEILQKSEDYAMKKNDSKMEPENQGVLFAHISTEKGVDTEAWVISRFGIVRWSNLGWVDFPEHAPFFSFVKKEWIENKTVFKRMEDLKDLFERSRPDPFEMTPVPIANYTNRIAHLYGSVSTASRINKSRTIIRSNPGLVFEGELLLKYDASRNIFYNKRGVEARLSESSRIRTGFTNGRDYRTVPVGRTASGIEVDVRDAYFKGMEILIHEVANVYYPSSEKEIIDASNYYGDEIVSNHPRVIRYGYPVMPDGGYNFDPIHIETPALFYMMSMYEGFDFAELFVNPKSRLSPVYFRSTPCERGPGYMIESVIVPINPSIRGYHL